ncbi:hypothetical protein [Cupriavidus sp. YR651]|uniref:hypothetical protein n=1 Tax=Cupriavidus sp. YR651 TaxID=1855315 RepID=UPI000B81A2EC|nr:hypothetical protein [Cupriavidus sp. YR651]
MMPIFSLTVRALGICALVTMAAIASRQLYLRIDEAEVEEYATPDATMLEHCEAMRRHLDGRRVSEPASLPVTRGRCMDS